MRPKPRWMKSVIDTAGTELPALPFERGQLIRIPAEEIHDERREAVQ